MTTQPRKRGRTTGSPAKLEASKVIRLCIDAATLARLDKIAAERKETRSAAIRSLIDLY